MYISTYIYIYIYSEWLVFWQSGGFSGNPGGFLWDLRALGARARFPCHVLKETPCMAIRKTSEIQLGVLKGLQTSHAPASHGKPPSLRLFTQITKNPRRHNGRQQT